MLVIPVVKVPVVEGLPLERAVAEIVAAGLTVDDPVVYEFSRDVAPNYVISQTNAGEEVRQNTPIRLYVSKGVETVEIPQLTGLPLEEAEGLLAELGVPEENITVDEDHSDQQAGTVIGQFPLAGHRVDPLSVAVRLEVSQGPDEVIMPNLIGLLPQEAQAALERQGLELLDKNIVYDKEFFEKGKVFKQFPYQPGEPVKPPGHDIMIYVSDGLPENARVTTYTVSIGPKTEGEESDIRILVSDAMGDGQEKVARKVMRRQSFAFQVVTSPGKDALIEVYQDGSKVEQYIWTYSQAAGSGIPASSSGGTAAGDSGGDAGETPEAETAVASDLPDGEESEP